MYDMKNLKSLKEMAKHAPEAMQAFREFDKAALAEGAIPVRYKELIAIAVAHATQCPYCIAVHLKNARKAGASEAEIIEAVMVSSALQAGAAVVHGTHCIGEDDTVK